MHYFYAFLRNLYNFYSGPVSQQMIIYGQFERTHMENMNFPYILHLLQCLGREGMFIILKNQYDF